MRILIRRIFDDNNNFCIKTKNVQTIAIGLKVVKVYNLNENKNLSMSFLNLNRNTSIVAVFSLYQQGTKGKVDERQMLTI